MRSLNLYIMSVGDRDLVLFLLKEISQLLRRNCSILYICGHSETSKAFYFV